LASCGEIEIVVLVYVEDMNAGKLGIVHTGLFHRTGNFTLLAAVTIYGIYFYLFAGHGSLAPCNFLVAQPITVGWPVGLVICSP
jgi:hypothetical protein